MPDACRPFFADELKVFEPGKVEGANQFMITIVGDRVGHRPAADRRRLETPGSPAGVEVEATNGCGSHDRGEVGRHVAKTGPLPQDFYVGEARKQIEHVTAQPFDEIER